MISINHRSLDEMANAISELETLTSKPTLTSRDEKRHEFLLAKLSALKAGVNPGEMRHWEQDRLLQQAGLPRAPEPGRRGRLDEDAENDWRNFANGREFRETCIPPDRETRAYTGELAGTESIAYTQGPAGGTFVAQGMSTRLYQSLKQYDAIFDPEFSNVVETATGGSTAFPIWDDVNNQAVQVGETLSSGEVEVASLSTFQLNAYSFRSKIVAVSLELLQDSNWPIGAILERVFAKRIARGVGGAMISGTGTASPTGLLTGAIAAGATIIIANGSSGNTGGAETGATSIGTADVGRLYAALNPAYRSNAVWYMQDATLQALAQLLDKNGRPIIDFGIGPVRADDVPSIWGHPVAVCPTMPTVASGHNSIVFADPDYIVQRRVPSATYVRRFTQAAQLVEAGLVGFEEWARFDSNFVSGNATYAPAAVLQNHS